MDDNRFVSLRGTIMQGNVHIGPCAVVRQGGW